MSSERKKAASSKWRFPRDLSARGALRQGRHADPDSGDAEAGRELGFPLTRMVAHAETAVDDWSGQRQRIG